MQNNLPLFVHKQSVLFPYFVLHVLYLKWAAKQYFDAVKVELRRFGVVFEGNDLPDLITVNGMVEVFGSNAYYGGKGERGAWFRG